jgi:hypothetical protein
VYPVYRINEKSPGVCFGHGGHNGSTQHVARDKTKLRPVIADTNVLDEAEDAT